MAKKRKAPPYTQLTLKHLRKFGYQCQVVERWCAFSRRRIDLFGVIDIVAVHNGMTAGVQASSGTQHATRRNKILAEPKALRWIRGGNMLWLLTWQKKPESPDSKREVWHPRLEVFDESDFEHLEEYNEEKIIPLMEVVEEGRAAKARPHLRLVQGGA